jgi:hypothetical protein
VKESDVNKDLKSHHKKAIYTTRKDTEVSSEALNHKPLNAIMNTISLKLKISISG